jgi:hypothetical protein
MLTEACSEYRAFCVRIGAPDVDADVIVAVGERGGVRLNLGWVRAEERYARV